MDAVHLRPRPPTTPLSPTSHKWEPRGSLNLLPIHFHPDKVPEFLALGLLVFASQNRMSSGSTLALDNSNSLVIVKRSVSHTLTGISFLYYSANLLHMQIASYRLSLYLSLSLYNCLYVSFSAFLTIFDSVCLCISVSVYVCLPLPLSLPHSLCFCLCLSASLYWSLSGSMYLSLS